MVIKTTMLVVKNNQKGAFPLGGTSQGFVDAAEESLALATETGPRPKVETRRFAGHIQKQVRGDLERFARELNPDFDAYYRRETITPDAIRGGVGVSGRSLRSTGRVGRDNGQRGER